MKPVRLGAVVIPPVTAIILATLLACFIVSGIVANFVPTLAVGISYLPVSTAAVLDGQVWRLLSYAFIHTLEDPWHVLMNSFFIYMFGRDLEVRWGTSRYLLFAVLTVVIGGAFVVVAGLLIPGSGGVTVGASAFAQGLLVAWGLTNRDAEMRLFFAVPARGIHLVWLSLFLWLLQAVSTSSTSASAHLGGMITAAILVLGVWRPNAVKLGWSNLLEKLGLKKKQKLYVVPKPSDQKWVN